MPQSNLAIVPVCRQGRGKYTCKASGGKYEGEYRDDKKVGVEWSPHNCLNKEYLILGGTGQVRLEQRGLV